MVNITLNGIAMQVEPGATILECANKAGVHIPTLCHINRHDIKMVNQVATCRVCMVEVEGRRNLAPACNTVVTEGMVIRTDTMKAIRTRRKMVELFLSNHPKDCLVCARNQTCELQSLASELGIRSVRYIGKQNNFKKDTSSLSLVRDPNKCVMCRRCETMCNVVQTVGVYSAVHRGFEATIGTAFDAPMIDTTCTFCGQCVSVCPTGALTQVDNTVEVWDALNDPDKFVVVQTAPAVRVALGEEFDLPLGTSVTRKLVSALKHLGFDKVYDTDFAADLTIMEEAREFIDRLQNGGTLPILTSCCPAWVKFIEHQFPELLDIPSTCKSPHEMFGAIAKTYLAEKLGVDPEKMVVVSVMPCLAKKYEAARPELTDDSRRNVDLVITTRELAAMIREAGINFHTLQGRDYDSTMGESTGASVIFGTTGGVIEAALRTAYSWMTGTKPPNVEFTDLRGIEGIKEATYNIGGQNVKIAVAHGLGNTRELLEAIRDGKAQYHAIEIMACPGGCVSGGGQPYHNNDPETMKKRAEAIYAEDRSKSLRMSHENPEIIKLYEEYLGEPGSELAHHLLHTHYTKRNL